MLKKFEHFQHLAELYHVYHSIQRFMVRPAATFDPNVSHSEISEKNYLKVAKVGNHNVISKHFCLLKVCPFHYRPSF